MKNFYFICILCTFLNFNYSSYQTGIGITEFIDESTESLIEHPVNQYVTENQPTFIKQYVVPCMIIVGISTILLCLLYKHYTTANLIVPTATTNNDNLYCNSFFNAIKPFFFDQEDSVKMLSLSYCRENIEEFEAFCEKNECIPLIKDYHFLLKHFAKLNKYCSEILFDY